MTEPPPGEIGYVAVVDAHGVTHSRLCTYKDWPTEGDYIRDARLPHNTICGAAVHRVVDEDITCLWCINRHGYMMRFK